MHILFILTNPSLRDKRVPKSCPWGTIAKNGTLFSKGTIPLRVPYYGQSNSAPRGTLLVPFFLSVLLFVHVQTNEFGKMNICISRFGIHIGWRNNPPGETRGIHVNSENFLFKTRGDLAEFMWFVRWELYEYTPIGSVSLWFRQQNECDCNNWFECGKNTSQELYSLYCFGYNLPIWHECCLPE